MNLNPDTGALELSDPWADDQIPLTYKGNQFLGNLRVLSEVKRENPGLKTLFSVGGWTYKDSFRRAIDTPAKIAQFVATAKNILEKYEFDGIDLDFEYPELAEDGRNYSSLVEALRASLGQSLITMAIPAMPYNLKHFDLGNLNRSVDFFNVMAYDFAGSWSSVSAEHSNLSQSSASEWSVVQLIDHITTLLPSQALVLGMPAYGKLFQNCGGIRQPFSNCLDVSYKDIASNKVGTAKDFVSYDSPEEVEQKGEYAKKKSLAGGFWWDSSGGDLTDHFLKGWNKA